MSLLFKRIIASGYLLLMFFLIAVNAVFLHSHVLPDGTTIVHAHPYNKSQERKQPQQKHEHRFFEYLSLDNTMHYIAPVFEFVFSTISSKIIEINHRESYLILQQSYLEFNNKAPPLFLLG